MAGHRGRSLEALEDMNLLRAIAQHYATLPNLIVPADRFTEGLRPPTDQLPAIMYQRNTEDEDGHQLGAGLSTAGIQMTIWSATPAQGHRIEDQLRDAFHWMRWTTIGTGDDATLVKLCRLDNTADLTEYPDDASASFACNTTLYFNFQYQRPDPSTVPVVPP